MSKCQEETTANSGDPDADCVAQNNLIMSKCQEEITVSSGDQDANYVAKNNLIIIVTIHIA